VTGMMPMHKAKGKRIHNSILNNDRKMGPLMRHFEYMGTCGRGQSNASCHNIGRGDGGPRKP
jgi:hypothetical protein